ncbi:MAG: ATP-binding protein, partial [Planctomycetia bacterium]
MTPLSAAPSADRDRLLAGLAAGLSRGGIWSAPAVVAVSGGADSTALLLGLVALAPPGSRIVVAHAEHDLRADAAADREGVAALAARLGVGFVTSRLAVRA